jgi:membrane protein DedA with SNARE-associated domain
VTPPGAPGPSSLGPALAPGRRFAQVALSRPRAGRHNTGGEDPARGGAPVEPGLDKEIPVPGGDLIYTLAWWFGFLVSAAFGNPVPEEVMIVSAGVHAASMDKYGLFRFLVLPTVLAGALVADVLLYALGRLFGTRLMETSWMKRLSPPEKRERIAENFHHYGFVIFALGRMVPGIRTTLFLTAGTMRLSLLRFCLADGFGALIGGSVFFFLGYALGSQFQDVIENWEASIAPYKLVLLILLIIALLAYLIWSFLRRPIPTGDPEEVPLIGHQIATHLPDLERQSSADDKVAR